MKKVGKTTRLLRYDLNQTPCDYTMEVTNRFKGLDLIGRVPEELWIEVHDIIQEAVIKTIPKSKKCKKANKVVWYSHLMKNFPQFIVIHTVKGFGIVKKAEIDVFLELFCFFHDPADVGNLISGSSAFSKTSLNIRKFTVHVLLKPGLENFEHYFASV